MILLVVSAGWFLSLGSRLIYPVILPQLMTEYRITYGTAGIALSVLWLSYALVSAPGGLIADRIGERSLLFWSAVVTAGGAIAVVAAPTFGVFLLATATLGIGTGLYGTTGTTVLTDVYTHRDTTAVSVSQVAGTAGTIVLPVVSGLLAVAVGWRLGVAYVVPGFVLLAVGLRYTIPERTSPPAATSGQSAREFVRTVREPFFNRTLLLLVCGMTAVGFVYQGLSGFLPAYLIETKGFSQRDASLLFGLFMLSMIAAKVLCGPVSRRYGDRRSLVGFALLGTPAIVAFPFVDSVPGIVSVVWFSGIILGYTPIATTYAMLFIPGSIQGTAFGIVRTSFLGVGALAPPLIGLLADEGLFDVAFVGLALAGVVAVAVSLLLPEKRS